MAAHKVRVLLMGGQACVFYGAAEFSRDVDFVVLAGSENLKRLRAALKELLAELVYVPSLTQRHLKRGHAIHFRCHHCEAADLRVDVMSRMRGVAPFEELWARRTTFREPGEPAYELLSLPDLVQAKKTQQDKDWPMIRRLMEADYTTAHGEGNDTRFSFWFRELRTPELLIEAAQSRPRLCARVATERPLLLAAATSQHTELVQLLEREEMEERERDRMYWKPLRAELERLRHQRLA